MSLAIFDPHADQARYRTCTSMAAPSRSYAILFTPRSGSSWLTSILTATRAMGTPSEWFNPSLMPKSTRAKGARNLGQFIAAISRHQSHGDMFGFEITYHQLRAVFGSDAAFLSHFRSAAFFWLIRADIVAQGVSLDKMVATSIGHAANASDDEIVQSDQRYDYNPGRIKAWIRHIRAAEQGTERMIAENGLKPIRLSYEALTAAGAARTAAFFAESLGLPPIQTEQPASPHRKIATEKNGDFARLFRQENRRFVASLEAERASMVAQCDAGFPTPDSGRAI